MKMQKTKDLDASNWKENPPDFNDIKGIHNIKALVVEFGYNIDYDIIWLHKFHKFKKKIAGTKETLL